jgi:hypothetical protein
MAASASALDEQGGDGEDGQVDVLVAPVPRSKAPARAAKKSAYRSRAPGRSADGLDVLELEGAALPEGGQLVHVEAAQQLIGAVHGGHVGGGQGQAEAGGGDRL